MVRVVARAASFREDLVVFDTKDGEAVCRIRCGLMKWLRCGDALVLGTRDYVRKCGFSKALVGLSGGIDSALVAAIAVEALGGGERDRGGNADGVLFAGVDRGCAEVGEESQGEVRAASDP